MVAEKVLCSVSKIKKEVKILQREDKRKLLKFEFMDEDRSFIYSCVTCKFTQAKYKLQKSNMCLLYTEDVRGNMYLGGMQLFCIIIEA